MVCPFVDLNGLVLPRKHSFKATQHVDGCANREEGGGSHVRSLSLVPHNKGRLRLAGCQMGKLENFRPFAAWRRARIRKRLRGPKKGSGTLLCEAPFGLFRQMVPDPFLGPLSEANE